MASMILLYLSSFLTGGLAFVTNVIMARELGPEDYGFFIAILAVITLVSSFATAGVPHFWLRVFGQEGRQAIRWVKSTLYLVSVSIFVISMVLVAWAYWGPHSLIFQNLIIWLFFPVLAGQVLFELVVAKLQLEEKYGALSLWQLLLNSLRFLWVSVYFSILTDEYDLINLSIGVSLCSIVLVIFGVFSLKEILQGKLKLKGHSQSNSYKLLRKPTIKNVIEESYPFALAGFLYVVYYQSDIILLKYLDSAESAGIYNVSFIILGAVYLFPAIFYQRFLLPKLHRWAVHDKAKFISVYQAGNRIMLLAGLGVMGIIFLVVPAIIPVIFGDAYISVIPLIMILALCIPCRFLSSSIESVFVEPGNMKRKVKCMGVTALLNVILNIIVIPIWGNIGAAATTFISELVLVILFYLTARKHVY